MSLFASTERISFADAVPRVVPESKLSSSGVAEIVVVDGVVKGMSVPELFERLMVLSAVGSTTLRVVSKSSAVVPSKETFLVFVVVILLIFPPVIVIVPSV